MDFTFPELELSLRDAVRDVLAAEGGPDQVRRAWAAAPGTASRKAWEALVGLGVTDALRPEPSGGLGLGEGALVLIFEEVGRVALAEPLLETVVLGAVTLAAEEAGGTGLMVAASTTLAHPAPDRGWQVHRRSGTRSTEPWRATVPWGAEADVLLVEGPRGSWYRLDARDVETEPVPSVDGARRLAQVTWERGAGRPIQLDPVSRNRALDGAAVVAAAELVGLSQAMLDMTVTYVTGRNQFGVPVGSFQAVKHQLASAATALEFARPLVHRAAWSLSSHSPEAERDVSMAKGAAGDAAGTVGRACLQCHGAIGYTTEYDLHLYLKRTWALGRAWGDGSAHRSRVAAWLGI